jgi:hypothetical protein
LNKIKQVAVEAIDYVLNDVVAQDAYNASNL